MPTSFKLIFFCFIFGLAACNSSSNNKSESKDAKVKKGILPADSMSKEALFSFIDGCVANSKLTLGEEKAFAFCKCIYEQIRTANPGMDSARVDAMVNDTAQVAKMAANCR